MKEDNFEWTDALKKEFADFILSGWANPIEGLLEIFKREKQKQVDNNRDWEIISYDNYNYTLPKKSTIHSVRRISTNEIFSIGDEITLGRGGSFKIISFQIQGNQTDLMVEYERNHRYNLMYIDKIKQPLFTTFDGKPIYEGETAYYIEEERNFNIVVHCNITKPNDRKYFSTKEAAETFILENKPCLSLIDVRKWIEKCSDYPNSVSINQLVSIVKEKLKAI